MEIFVIRLLQFVLAISILVLLHEGGHFFFSKLFGVRVEKFFLFFDPWFHLFQWKPKKSDTTYGIGWLPLGGYCKISGMIDESFDTEQMKQPAQPFEFRSKPAWQRLLIMAGGVMVNFVLALFIYSMIMFYWGDTYVATKDMTHGMKFNVEAKQLGFRDGDILVGTDKGEFKGFSADVFRDISEAHRADIIRGGKRMSIALPGELNLLDMLKKDPMFLAPLMPSSVDSVMKGSPAEKIGLRHGDRISGLNGLATKDYNDFTLAVRQLADVLASAQSLSDSLRVRTVSVTYVRPNGAQADTLTAQTLLTPDLKMGYYNTNYTATYKTTHVSYGLLESIPAGCKYGWDVLSGYVSDMRYVFSSDGVKSLGGFGTLGSLFPPVWDWYLFWKMTAFFSIILAFMNILPIPALDGGHIMFLFYEMITRRKPGEKFMIYAEYVGITILIILMLVANLNDILRWLGYM